jgi:hypothetical protein
MRPRSPAARSAFRNHLVSGQIEGLPYSDPHDAVDRLGHSVLHPYFVDGAHVVLFSW